ncbi:MAG: hypothetical protein SGJ24_17130 [Chloroflexota bacterium]|nr:hypothetical protein [Chloroflexota bacterium]
MRQFRVLCNPFWIVLIALITVIAAPAAAQYDPNVELPRPTNSTQVIADQPGYLIVNTDNLNLRSGDSARTVPVAILDGGTELVVVGFNGRSGDRAWWLVEVGGLRGWVKDQFVIVRGDLRGTPIADSDGTILSPALYIGVTAPIFDILSVEGTIICNVPGNRFYAVVAQSRADDPTWYKIRALCAGQTVEGWVFAQRGILRNSANVSVPVETE